MATITWNVLDKGSGVTLSNNNFTTTIVNISAVRTVSGKSSGKWYWEIKLGTSTNTVIGVGTKSASLSQCIGADKYSWSCLESGGNKYGAGVMSTYSTGFATNDIIGVALDCDNGTISYYKNGINQGVAFSTLPKGTILFPMIGSGGNTTEIATANFGATTFTYSIPTGYKAYDTPPIKYLIKQNSNYYTIKSTNYDLTATHNFIPLTLTGGLLPNKSDIETFGFDDLSILTNNMTVNTDTFIPLSKLDNQFEIKMYKG